VTGRLSQVHAHENKEPFSLAAAKISVCSAYPASYDLKLADKRQQRGRLETTGQKNTQFRRCDYILLGEKEVTLMLPYGC